MCGNAKWGAESADSLTMHIPARYQHSGKRHVSSRRLVTDGLPGTVKEARLRGLTRYFTGKPCPRGHITDRLVSTRKCIACSVDDEKRRDPLKLREKARRNSWKHNKLPTPTRPCPAKCELCGGPPTSRALHLDHDKKTGAFRGWLCHYCNTNLGRFGDDIEGLMRAVRYLQGQTHHGD